VRYLLVLPLCAVLAAGCGGSESRPAAAAKRAPVLVSFQRNGGATATLDAVLVRADGWTRSDKRYGGAGRRYDDFRLSAPMLRSLRAGLRRLPARLTDAGHGDRGGAMYLLRYGATSYYARQGAVPRALAPVVRTLEAIVNGGGRSGHVHHVSQAPA
jgi:hypothetical protein